MMGAVLQLERFDRAPDAPPPAAFARADLDAAFARGRVEGRAEAEARQVETLLEALAGLSRRLEAEEAARLAASASGVRAIAPLIEALLDGIGSAAARGRLKAALMDEMLRLASVVTPLVPRLRCGPDLVALVAACVNAAGMTGVEIDPTGPEGTAEVDLQGGRVTWDMGRITADLREIVAELMEDE